MSSQSENVFLGRYRYLQSLNPSATLWTVHISFRSSFFVPPSAFLTLAVNLPLFLAFSSTIYLSIILSLFLLFSLLLSPLISLNFFHPPPLEDGDKAVTSVSTTSGKSRLANSEADIALYLSSSGTTRDCWTRLAEQIKNSFGIVDMVDEKENVEEQIESGSNEKKVQYRMLSRLFFSVMIAAPSIPYRAFAVFTRIFTLFKADEIDFFYYRRKMIFLRVI